MPEKLVGTAVRGITITEVQAQIQRAEELGVHAAWMTAGGASLDSMTCFAAFAASGASTNKIKLGTSIVPTYPRHPLVAVQQAQVVAQLAPGRFRPQFDQRRHRDIEGTAALSAVVQGERAQRRQALVDRLHPCARLRVEAGHFALWVVA